MSVGHRKVAHSWSVCDVILKSSSVYNAIIFMMIISIVCVLVLEIHSVYDEIIIIIRA